jgi:threonine/homoserine/homoserine lactone efflux protein
MTFQIWLAYISAVLILMITPGPSQLLMLSNSLGSGFRKSIATVAGDLTANSTQMTIASVGLVSILYASQYTFMIIKWLGVAYLVYMGVRLIMRNQSEKVIEQEQTKSIKTLYMQGFITSTSNPKAIIFFAALFPQFLNPNEPVAMQLLVLGLTYITIDGIFLSVYGLFANWIAQRFKGQITRNLDRISGSFLIGAAILLGLKKIEV